jgi:hypothetical protein
MRRPICHPAIKHNFTDTIDGKICSKSNPFIDRKAILYHVFTKDIFSENAYGKLKYELMKLYLLDNGEFYFENNHLGIYTFNEIKEMIEKGEVTTELPGNKNFELRIFDMGIFPITIENRKEYSFFNFIKTKEFLKQLEDDSNYFKKLPSFSKICFEKWEKYLKDKTNENKEELRIAYENVPEHQRRFILCNMDLKDIPIRMVIYGEREKENWIHRIVAKTLIQDGIAPNLEMPDIKI